MRISRGRLTSALVGVAAATTAGLAMISPAHAFTEYYCGILIPSTSGYSCSTNSYTNLTYNQASYSGGGNIQQLRSLLSPDGGSHTALNATISKYCRTTSTLRYGGVGQYDGTANHTIYGYADDSAGHTGCV